MAAGTVIGGLKAKDKDVVVCLMALTRAPSTERKPSGIAGTGFEVDDEEDARGPNKA